jgi:hypothetical protein
MARRSWIIFLRLAMHSSSQDDGIEMLSLSIARDTPPEPAVSTIMQAIEKVVRLDTSSVGLLLLLLVPAMCVLVNDHAAVFEHGTAITATNASTDGRIVFRGKSLQRARMGKAMAGLNF